MKNIFYDQSLKRSWYLQQRVTHTDEICPIARAAATSDGQQVIQEHII